MVKTLKYFVLTKLERMNYLFVILSLDLMPAANHIVYNLVPEQIIFCY